MTKHFIEFGHHRKTEYFSLFSSFYIFMTGFILWKTKAILTTSALTFSVWIKKIFFCVPQKKKKVRKGSE